LLAYAELLDHLATKLTRAEQPVRFAKLRLRA